MSWMTSQKLGILPEHYPQPIKVQKVEQKQELESSNVPRALEKQTPDLTDMLSGVQNLSCPTQAELEIVKDKVLKKFSDVFNTEGELQAMQSGEPMKIHLKEDAVPFQVTAARAIPFAHREQAKADLDKMEAVGAIEKVGDEVSEWCHPMVLVDKPDGTYRITTDLTKLNSQVLRQVYPSPSPKDIVNGLDGESKYFSTLDCVKGYWQVELEEGSRHLTTFITPWGRYRYKRCVMGFIGTGDEYNRRGDIILGNVQGLKKLVDDILLHHTTFAEHVRTLVEVLHRCRQH